MKEEPTKCTPGVILLANKAPFRQVSFSGKVKNKLCVIYLLTTTEAASQPAVKYKRRSEISNQTNTPQDFISQSCNLTYHDLAFHYLTLFWNISNLELILIGLCFLVVFESLFISFDNRKIACLQTSSAATLFFSLLFVNSFNLFLFGSFFCQKGTVFSLISLHFSVYDLFLFLCNCALLFTIEHLFYEILEVSQSRTQEMGRQRISPEPLGLSYHA